MKNEVVNFSLALCLALSVSQASAWEKPTTKCLIIGDSIAQGVANHSRCQSFSEGGLSSWRWLNKWGKSLETARPDTVLISLGANDATDRRSFESLLTVRSKIQAEHVMWLAPSERLSTLSRHWVRLVAEHHGDAVYELPQAHLQRDGIHQTGAGARAVARGLLPE